MPCICKFYMLFMRQIEPTMKLWKNYYMLLFNAKKEITTFSICLQRYEVSRDTMREKFQLIWKYSRSVMKI